MGESALRNFAAGLIGACASLTAQCASAEIVDIGAGGFSLRENAHVSAPPDKVYAALTEPGRWWSSQHTFSGDAANMHLDAKAGGCWCESLPHGGSVLHLTVVNVVPGKLLRLRGGLGPFQSIAVDGVLTWSLSPSGDGTDVVLSNSQAGYLKGGFDAIAHGADGVLGEQIGRLKLYVETGSPESPHKDGNAP
jgi:uncharacterized protein YndB with AHSA1/START domain